MKIASRRKPRGDFRFNPPPESSNSLPLNSTHYITLFISKILLLTQK